MPDRDLPRYVPRAAAPHYASPSIRAVRLDWVECAAHLSGKCLHVAMALWWIASFHRQARVRLKAGTLRRFNVTGDAYPEALRCMEHAGLIRVDAGPDDRPRVTLLDVLGRPLRFQRH
jgi:hypothetical protein